MKPSRTLIAASLLLAGTLTAQGYHMSPDHNIPHGSSTVCWGYAMARSAGKTANDSVCGAMTVTGVGLVNTSYFAWNERDPATYQSWIDELNAGDILAFAGRQHVSYVRTASGSNIRLDQVENEGSTLQQCNIPLETVISGDPSFWNSCTASDVLVRTRGNPMGYYRRKQVNITVQNDFNESNGGQVKVDGSTVPAGNIDVRWWSWIDLEAIDPQSYGGEVWDFDEWTIPGGFSEDNPLPIVAKIGADYTAYFLTVYNVTFENAFIGIGDGGVIKVNDVQYSAPKTVQVTNTYSVDGEAMNQTITGIDYSFSEWNDDNTSQSRTFYPGSHVTYTAEFTGQPVQVSNVHNTGSVGQSVQLAWDAHPNSSVNYHIIRRVKDQSSGWGDPETLAYLSHGTTSYTDDRYTKTRSYTQFLLNYDVRAHYTIENSSADVDWYVMYGGDPLPKRIGANQPGSLPVAFALESAYPNPFNPSTTIRYDLPEASEVAMVIYDLMGREVMRWQQARERPGYKAVVWTGTDQSGRAVPTGIYIYRLVAVSTESDKRFAATRKMLLMR